jgi:single-stranded DNA-binding protein
MSNDTKFIDGLIFKAPHENAPEYVIAKISIKRAELIAWLQSQQGDWVNADLKKSQQGKFYAAVDDWKPGTQRQEREPRREAEPATPAASGSDFADDDIPF